jgi:hypothetical protein
VSAKVSACGYGRRAKLGALVVSGHDISAARCHASSRSTSSAIGWFPVFRINPPQDVGITRRSRAGDYVHLLDAGRETPSPSARSSPRVATASPETTGVPLERDLADTAD